MKCAVFSNTLLRNPIEVETAGGADFKSAKTLADAEARKRDPDPMLLAWFDRRRNAFSPRVECCSEERPGWLVYAESRGGDLVFDINGGEYVFVYRSSREDH